MGGERWRRRSDGTGVQVAEPPVPSAESSECLFAEGDAADRLVLLERAGRLHVFDGSDWKTIAPSCAWSPGSLRAADMMNGRCLVGSERGVLEFDLVNGTSEVWDLDRPSDAITGLHYDADRDALWTRGLAR